MNTIMAYLDSMFNGLPKTAQLLQIKQDLLAGMEEKYFELKSQGKSENEAVGIVISEFGNIDEILAELGISNHHDEQLFELSEEAAYDYLEAKRINARWIGIGVFIGLLGVAFLISVVSLFEQKLFGESLIQLGSIIGPVGMFVLFAIAVSIFIMQGMKLQRFNYLEDGFVLDYHLKTKLKQEQTSFEATYRTSLIIGVSISILSPIIIFIAGNIDDIYSPYLVSCFLLTIGVAVYLFIYYGNIQGSYIKLLEDQNKESVNEKKKQNKLIGSLNIILFSLATAIFLFTGFVYDAWGTNWVIFVIAGVLSGMSIGVVSLLKSNH